MQLGKIIKKDSLVLRFAIGKAVDENTTNEYELTNDCNGRPLVKSLKSGKSWTITWNELIQLAIENGVDTHE